MKYPIAIEPGDETHVWSVVVPDLPGWFPLLTPALMRLLRTLKKLLNYG